MNMFKNAGGFTLVELIVVIAILAILAGVAIPVYSGYITSANETVDQQEIEAINTALAAAAAMEGLANAKANITYTFANSTITIEEVANDATDVWDNFQQFYGKTAVDGKIDVPMKQYDATKIAAALELNVKS